MILNECPNCHGGLKTTGKTCCDCGLELRGSFDDNQLVRLPREDQDFLLEFVLASGNFKALGERLDLSYPTLRSRLDRILERLQGGITKNSSEQVLSELEAGVIPPDAAIAKLRKLAGK